MFDSPKPNAVKADYARAKDRYAAIGVDADAAVDRLAEIPLSIHCWQGDDVGGFEVRQETVVGGGILATGAYPGKARNADELRMDLDRALSLIPGASKVNLHASYAETGGKPVDRDALTCEHFARWIDWANHRRLGLDFNPTFFAHSKADTGYTLSSADEEIRRFWVNHGIASRRIASAMGAATGQVCVSNVWLPDGAKDQTIDRTGPRERLVRSLDEVFAEKLDPATIADAVEGKLFGLGSEDYVVGSHEFYLAYCLTRGKVLCMDMGHYHPTETIHDKLSAALAFLDKVLLHISRGVRWDSDHVVIADDDVRCLAHEVVRARAVDRVYFALDFFDASINRIAAWVTGARSWKRALLEALLEPVPTLRDMEREGRGGAKLALLQELTGFPVGAVWDHFCLTHDVPVGPAWIDDVDAYEKDVLSKR